MFFFLFFPFFVYLFCQIDAKKCTYGSRVDSGKKTTTKYDGRNKMQTWKCISKTTVNTTKSAHSRSNGVTDLIWIHVEIKKQQHRRGKLCDSAYILDVSWLQFQIGKRSRERNCCENQWQSHKLTNIIVLYAYDDVPTHSQSHSHSPAQTHNSMSNYSNNKCRSRRKSDRDGDRKLLIIRSGKKFRSNTMKRKRNTRTHNSIQAFIQRIRLRHGTRYWAQLTTSKEVEKETRREFK